MKRAIITLLAVSVFVTASFASAAPKAPLSTPILSQSIGKGKPTLVFFQNPNGGPCKAQQQVLDKLTEKRKGTFTLAPVNAMDQNDQKAFYDYGVRSLPSLVLVDKAGTISKVFPPGIQSIETISAALDGLK
ncbi:MAG TPA: thioredoxin family protein [Desulfuromonadales bacterium]|nr:thioredoxin family protein [Desulfuromonadales bacterium]